MTSAVETHSEQTIELEGRKLRYLKGGSGRPLMVLHHSTGNLGWLPIHEQLASNFQVIVPDMPGYGGSERPDWAREPRDLAILMLQALDKLGLEQINLVGLGFGGFVAAEMATMNQSRLASLVLIGAPGIQPDEGEIMDQMMVDYPEYVKAGFAEEATFVKLFGEPVDQEVQTVWDFSREMTARLTWKPYMFNRRLPHLLKEVQTPALLIWGERDAVVPPVVGQQYKRALRNAKLEVVRGCGHLVEMEEPERVAALIAAHAR